MTVLTKFVVTAQYYEDYGTRWKPKGSIHIEVPEDVAKDTEEAILEYFYQQGWAPESLGPIFSISKVWYRDNFDVNDLFAVELTGSIRSVLADKCLLSSYPTVANIIEILEFKPRNFADAEPGYPYEQYEVA